MESFLDNKVVLHVFGIQDVTIGSQGNRNNQAIPKGERIVIT
jgi:hypothetical protein